MYLRGKGLLSSHGRSRSSFKVVVAVELGLRIESEWVQRGLGQNRTLLSREKGQDLGTEVVLGWGFCFVLFLFRIGEICKC